MKRAAIYMRHSIVDANLENQRSELRRFVAERGFEVFAEYIDLGLNRARSRRPGLERMVKDATQNKFEAVFVQSCDRLARDSSHLLQVIDQLQRLGIGFISLREAIDTDGPVGAAIVLVFAALNALDRSLKVERIKLGMRRATLEGRRLGRAPLNVDHAGLVLDRLSGMSLNAVAEKYRLSRSSVVRFVHEAKRGSLGGLLTPKITE